MGLATQINDDTVKRTNMDDLVELALGAEDQAAAEAVYARMLMKMHTLDTRLNTSGLQVRVQELLKRAITDLPEADAEKVKGLYDLDVELQVPASRLGVL